MHFRNAVALAIAVLLGLVGQHYLVEERSLTLGLTIWAVALFLFVGGLWWNRNAHRGTDGPATETPLRRVHPHQLMEILLVVVVISVGVFLRTFKVGNYPPGLNHDAAWNGLYAIRVSLEGIWSPYVAEAWGRETMFHYIIAFFQVFLGPSQSTIWLAAVAVGICTLAAFYLMVRRLLGFRVALIATYLLSISGWHITMSSVGWRAVLVPLFVALVFDFLIKAVQERRKRDFVAAGVLLGLSLYTYDAARVLPLVAVAYLIYHIIRDPKLIRANLVHLVMFGLAFSLTLAPLAWFALQNWDAFTGRAGFLWIGAQIEQEGSIQPLWTNIMDSLLMFNYRANGNDFFVTEPLLDIPVSVFFALGFIYALTKLRQPAYFLLVAMLLLIVVVGVASVPNGNRAIGAVVPATVLAALILVDWWRWLSSSYPRYRNLFLSALVGVLLYSGYATYDSYLGPDRRVQWGFYPEATQVGNYMHHIAADYEIYAAADNWPRDTLTYLSYQGWGDPFERVYEYHTDATQLLGIRPALNGRGTAFIVEATPKNTTVLETLALSFPDAVVQEIHHPGRPGGIVAHALLIPPTPGP